MDDYQRDYAYPRVAKFFFNIAAFDAMFLISTSSVVLPDIVGPFVSTVLISLHPYLWKELGLTPWPVLGWLTGVIWPFIASQVINGVPMGIDNVSLGMLIFALSIFYCFSYRFATGKRGAVIGSH